MHHADATCLRGGGVISEKRFFGTVESNTPQRRRCDPAQDPHQRRLAGAVAANKTNHIGIGDREIDVGIGQRRSKGFGYSLQLDEMGPTPDRARLIRYRRCDTWIRQWPTPAWGTSAPFQEAPDTITGTPSSLRQ